MRYQCASRRKCVQASEVEEREKEDTWDTNTYFILVSFFFFKFFSPCCSFVCNTLSESASSMQTRPSLLLGLFLQLHYL